MSAPTLHQHREWAVQVGTWPPTPYQDRRQAEYYATHPFNHDRGYERRVVTRLVQTSEWAPPDTDATLVHGHELHETCGECLT